MSQGQGTSGTGRRSFGGFPSPPTLATGGANQAPPAGTPTITPTNQQQATTAGGLINLNDALELVKAAMSSNKPMRAPEIKNVPKLKGETLEEIVLWVESVAYMVQARIGSADPIVNPNFARDHLPRDGKPGFDLRVSAGTATDAKMTAMMRNEYAAGCLLSGACDCKEVIAGLRDGWDEVNWPMGQVPVMLNRLYSRYIKHTMADKKVLEGMLTKIQWHDSMNPIVLKDKYARLEQMYAIGGFTLEEADKMYHLTTTIDQRSLYFNCIQTAWTRARPDEPTALQVIEVMSEH